MGDIITLTIGGERIQATGNHPFLVLDGHEVGFRPFVEELEGVDACKLGRWVEARHIRVGDLLYLNGRRTIRVSDVSSRHERTTVYNLTVAGFHTYAVGNLGTAVHNKGDSCHGNSKKSTNAQHGYEVVHVESGTVVKTGISGQALNQNGTSRRANAQAKQWTNDPNSPGTYEARVVMTTPEGPGARANALDWERENARKLAQEGHLQDFDKHKYPR